MMDRKTAKNRLTLMIRRIDEAVENGMANGYRICTSPDPNDPLAQFWGVNKRGFQQFGSNRTLVALVPFPSEKLAKRVLDMTGGYVVSMAHILSGQRKTMEDKLKGLK
jgi:hypothetical protein